MRATGTSSTDPPGWFGLVAFFAAGLLTPVVTAWAYRRGQRDGAGREGLEPPKGSMVGTTMWWGLGCFVPVLSWYAAVHLPTEWYKHGVRIGAQRGDPPTGFTSGRALATATVAPIVTALAVIVAITAATGDDTVQAFETGDCVEYQSAGIAETDCSKAHNAVVIDVWEIPGDRLPTETKIEKYALDNCPREATSFLIPDSTSWSRGDHDIICLEDN